MKKKNGKRGETGLGGGCVTGRGCVTGDTDLDLHACMCVTEGEEAVNVYGVCVCVCEDIWPPYM